MKKLGTSTTQSPTLVQESPGSSIPAVGSQTAQRPASRGHVTSALSVNIKDTSPAQSGTAQTLPLRRTLIHEIFNSTTDVHSSSNLPYAVNKNNHTKQKHCRIEPARVDPSFIISRFLWITTQAQTRTRRPARRFLTFAATISIALLIRLVL